VSPVAARTVNGGDSDPFNFSPLDIDLEFTLEDTVTTRALGGRPGPKSKPVIGYNPYDRTSGAKKPPPQIEPRRKPTDLRKLSEWIRLQREVEALKKERPE
jgi:hypothetical protein